MPVKNEISCEPFDMAPAVSRDPFSYTSHGARGSYERIKRASDIALSVLGIGILLPVMIGTAAAIVLEDGAPVIFVQERTGLNGRPFKMYKFRSMVKNARELQKELLSRNEMDGPAFKLRDDPRLTKVGRWIRRTSIDELPQLLNIIKGDMSIVGPRPLPVYETERMEERDLERHQVRPGLTCYWQCSGRNDIPFKEWMEMDRRYLETRSIRTDLGIMARTFRAVISGKGAR